jgi:hypothetical protein
MNGFEPIRSYARDCQSPMSTIFITFAQQLHIITLHIKSQIKGTLKSPFSHKILLIKY